MALACAIVLGATNIPEADQLQYHWRPVFPWPVSDSTLRRALEAIDTPVATRIERARAVIRRVVWTLLALRPGGFPWVTVCGREGTGGWYVLDLAGAGCLGDRLGRQRDRRAGRRAAARERNGRPRCGRTARSTIKTRRRMDLLPGRRADRPA
ncbi:hypothetical protein [Actinacidiphila soli]|uniref:hypothetical protein n=1 Tax=Actinacidiphila soli TaxID=2487275 RepID=UPI0013E28EF9|nr:hypothetical protein [Actinacidiphila soli]